MIHTFRVFVSFVADLVLPCILLCLPVSLLVTAASLVMCCCVASVMVHAFACSVSFVFRYAYCRLDDANSSGSSLRVGTLCVCVCLGFIILAVVWSELHT